MKRVVLLFLALLPTPLFAQDIALRALIGGLDKPVAVTHANDSRLFIATQRGQVFVYDRVRLREEPFLDIRNNVLCCGEKGFLGIAFHPRYKENGSFFISHVDASGATVIARYHVSANENVADASSRTVLLTIPHREPALHYAGHLAFGPEGYLYISIGDGGDDDFVHASRLDSLLGKILRIDVDQEPYAIPETNPFVGLEGVREEIWAYGFRNPWRFSFDRETGDLWIGDVGQDLREEIDLQAATSIGGENYGWYGMEGTHCHEDSGICENTWELTTLPLLEYSHDDGCSVTAGYRYRGTEQPGLRGTYFYADFCNGTISAVEESEDGKWLSRKVYEGSHSFCSFGEDVEGELYVVDYRGTIYTVHTAVNEEVIGTIRNPLRKRVPR